MTTRYLFTPLAAPCLSLALAACTPNASGTGKPVGTGVPTSAGDDADASSSGGADTASDDTEGGDDGLPPIPPTGGSCTFVYENAIVDGTGIDIHHLFIAPVDSPSWGEDLLGEEILPYGAIAYVERIPRGDYDTMVVDEDGYTYGRFGVTCDEDWYWTITLADLG